MKKEEKKIGRREFLKVLGGSALVTSAAMYGCAPKGEVKLAAQGADIENGFILVYGDIEINCTFRALINEQKDTIREKVCGVIF